MGPLSTDDDVVIRVGNPIQAIQTGGDPGQNLNGPGSAAVYDLKGWQSVRVRRSCEQFPSIFEVVATERYPGDNVTMPARPGDPCEVRFTRGFGSDLVIVGWVGKVIPRLSASRHEISIVGRSRCGDLVDCSAVWPTGTFNSMSVKSIAQRLAEQYSVTVTAVNDDGTSREDNTPIIPQLIVNWSETPFELIERIARFCGLMVYDGADGGLILSRAGVQRMATGIVEGKNVLSASIVYDMDGRYSEYQVRRLTMNKNGDSSVDPEGDIIATVLDQGVPRKRVKFILADTPGNMGLDYAQIRGEWEASRRYGRSTQIAVTVDSWRDGKGNLWEPNFQVNIDLPSLKLGRQPPTPQVAPIKWVIATVVFRRDERGTAADLTIMPSLAFDVLPVPLMPLQDAGPY